MEEEPASARAIFILLPLSLLGGDCGTVLMSGRGDEGNGEK